MKEIVGISEEEFLQLYDRANCLSFFPGKDPNQKGDKFPMRKAKEAAAAHRQHFRGRNVVFLGRQVAHAFGFPKPVLEFFEWKSCRDWSFRCTVVPHTSGCNHYWNDPANVERAREFFRHEIF